MTAKKTLYTLPEAAAKLRISLRSLYRVLQSKQGPRVTQVTARKAFIHAEDLDAWIKSRSQSSPVAHIRSVGTGEPNLLEVASD